MIVWLVLRPGPGRCSRSRHLLRGWRQWATPSAGTASIRSTVFFKISCSVLRFATAIFTA